MYDIISLVGHTESVLNVPTCMKEKVGFPPPAHGPAF